MYYIYELLYSTVIIIIRNLSIGLEPEYTAAAYATSLDSNATPAGSETVANMLLLFFAFYFFNFRAVQLIT